MDYNLAKELAESGFSQVVRRGLHVGNHDGEPIYYVPTLEELIEACGVEFMLTNECGNWEAFSKGIHRAVRMGEGGAKYETHGKTPLEAVAGLWLAINKK